MPSDRSSSFSLLSHYSDCAALVTVCCIWPITVCVARVMPVISQMVFESKDLGRERTESDNLLTHALIEISGIHWQSFDRKHVKVCQNIFCLYALLKRFWLLVQNCFLLQK